MLWCGIFGDLGAHSLTLETELIGVSHPFVKGGGWGLLLFPRGETQQCGTRIWYAHRHRPILTHRHVLPDSDVGEPYRTTVVQLIIIAPPVPCNTADGVAAVGEEPLYRNPVPRLEGCSITVFVVVIAVVVIRYDIKGIVAGDSCSGSVIGGDAQPGTVEGGVVAV